MAKARTKARAEMICDAYLGMESKAKYRPEAPGDGMGGIYLSEEELGDLAVLRKESEKYARRFMEEEDTLIFHIGCCDYTNTTAFVYAIEAARCLCAGSGFHKLATKLLKMAAREVGKDGK